MTQKNGFIAFSQEGGAAIKIPARMLIGQNFKRSLLKHRLGETFETDESQAWFEWIRGKDLNIAILYPRGRYCRGFLKKCAMKLKKLLEELGFADRIMVCEIHPSLWKG